MALKLQDNEVAETFPQNENLETQGCIVAYISKRKTMKNNSSGIKYGLSELSNDKTYLETELPARKRQRPETDNRTEYLIKTCNAVVNDVELADFINEEKYSSSPIVLSSNILDNKLKLESNEFTRDDFENKSGIQDCPLILENDLYENIDDDNISNQDTGSEIEFDDEVNKCCELLNLDVPKMAVVSKTDTKVLTENCGSKVNNIFKFEINSHKNSDRLNSQSTKLATLRDMAIENNIEAISLSKELKIQDGFLYEKKESCEDNIEFKEEINSVLCSIVTPNSLTNCNEISIGKIFHNKINVSVDDISLQSELTNSDKNDSILKLNSLLNVNSTSIKEPIFISKMINNHDSKIKAEHLGSTIQNTLDSNTLKLKGSNQNITQDHLSNNKNETDDILSAVDDAGDIISLYDESDLDFEEKEEEKNDLSTPAVLQGTSKTCTTIFLASLQDHDNKSCTLTDNEVKKEDDFTLNEKFDQVDIKHQLSDKNYESHGLNGVANNDCSENKYDNIKLNESFVSEYEISLLEEDTDSIFSVESLDSEYEISLLEDDINDEENNNVLHEDKSDSVDSNYLPNNPENNEKILTTESIDSEYEVSLLEDDIKSEENFSYLPNFSEKDEKITPIPQKNITNEGDSQNDLNENKFVSKVNSKYLPNSTKKENITNEEIHDSEYKKVLLEEVKNNKENCYDFHENKSHSNVSNYLPNGSVKCEKVAPVSQGHIKVQENSDLSLKFENVESQTKKNVTLASSNLKNSEEKNRIVNTANHHADNTCINEAINVKFIKAELDLHDIGKSKNKNEKMDEIKKSEEKVLMANTEKQLAENTVADKILAQRIEKSVSASSESQQDVKDKIPDYYEEEKEDLINPGWNKIKELSSDKERYRQVRDCWESKSIPNPFKNLTYYSYRKHKINCEDSTRQTRQHKRHASSNLNNKEAKRSRSCTYIFDDRIKSIEKEKEIKTKTLENKMFDEVNRLTKLNDQKEWGIHNYYGYSFDPRRQSELICLRRDHLQRVSSISAEYVHKVNSCTGQYTSEINKLKNNRNEVLQFYSFYKGLNTDEYKDPTILTDAQMQELEEIENIYKQMDLHYK